MKRKLWLAPLAALALVCTVVLSACGGPSVEELIREDVLTALGEISPDDEELLDAMTESADGGFEQLGVDPKEFATAYLEGYDYEIKDVVVDEESGTAEVTATVKMRSLTSIMTGFMTDFQEYVNTLDPTTIGSEEELYAQAGEIMMNAVKEAEVSETDVVIPYEKDDENTWSAAEDAEYEILNAMQ